VEKVVLSDGAWVLLGQMSSAAGTLVGVRLLTEVLDPAVFGSVALVTGVVALALSASSMGTLQAVLRLFPDCSREGTLDLLRGAASRKTTRATLWFGSALAVGCLIYSVASQSSLWSFVFVPGLLIVDTACSFQLTLLNAAGRQRLMAVWMGAGSWSRTIFALVAVKLLGGNADAVLWGYLVGSGFLLAVFYNAATAGYSKGRPDTRAGAAFVIGPDTRQGLEADLARYGKPLALLGLVGWLSGQADRYIIGGLLGLSFAGQYAAVYGLVSKPFLMAGGSIELIFRQVFYAPVSSGDLSQARKIFWQWLALVGAISAIGVLGFSVFYSKIASVLLAESYRDSAHLMPWIAIGYGLFLFSQVLERVCYATKETGAVLMIQTVGAISSIPVSAIGALWWGMTGAALAVPCYFGLQLAAAIYFALRAARNQFHHVTVRKDLRIS
jgi:O-antigen/teichoic acid export membrane protein